MLSSFITEMRSLLMIWCLPNAAIKRLLAKQSLSTLLQFVMTLSLIYFFQLTLLALIGYVKSSERLEFSMIITFAVAILGVSAIVAIGIDVILNLTTLAFCLLTNLVGGKGTLMETKCVLYGSTVISVPIGFLFLLALLCSKISVLAIREGLSPPAICRQLQFFLICSVLGLLMYTFVTIVKFISKIHKISFWRALPIVFLGLMASSASAIMLYHFVLEMMARGRGA